MATWTHRPQEQEGTYLFSGALFVTQEVNSALSLDEIFAIYFDMQIRVRERGGLDYLQVYENEAGDKLYFIDQCDPEMTASELFSKEDNHCILLFSHEY